MEFICCISFLTKAHLSAGAQAEMGVTASVSDNGAAVRGTTGRLCSVPLGSGLPIHLSLNCERAPAPPEEGKRQSPPLKLFYLR